MCVYNGRRVSRLEYDRLKAMERALKALQQLDMPVQYAYDYRDWPILRPTMHRVSAEAYIAHWEFLPHILPSAEYHLWFRNQWDTVNARSENILSSSLFRPGALTGRCLVPSSYFFEHRHLPQYGKKGQLLKEPRRIPYKVWLPEKELFYMAGISQWTRDEESGEERFSFAIVTTDASEHKLMSQVHNTKFRMPTILPESLADEWLFGELNERRIRELATHAFSTEEMSAYTVKKGFWNEPDPTAPVYYDDVPELIL